VTTTHCGSGTLLGALTTESRNFDLIRQLKIVTKRPVDDDAATERAA